MYENKAMLLKKSIKILLFLSLVVILITLTLLYPILFKSNTESEIFAILSTISFGYLLILFALFYDIQRFRLKYKGWLDNSIIRSIYLFIGIIIFNLACDLLILFSVVLKENIIDWVWYFDIFSIRLLLIMGYLGSFSGRKKKFINRLKNGTAFAEGVMDGDEGEFYGEFVRMFMDERTQHAENKDVKLDKLYEMYAEWSQMTGTLTLHKDIFIEKLKEFNYKIEPKNDKLYVQNITTDLLY